MAEVDEFDARTAGRRLDYLLNVLDGRPGVTYSNAEFAADLALQGQWVTIGEVERMRITGHRLNDPVMLAAIEAAVHVQPAYFSDSAVAKGLGQDLELLLAFAWFQDAYRRSGVLGMSICGRPAATDRMGTLEWYRLMTNILQDVGQRHEERVGADAVGDADAVGRASQSQVMSGPPRRHRRWFRR